MNDIISILKKSSKNFDKIGQLSKKLISSAALSKCGFRNENVVPCKTILADLLMLAFENKSLYQKAGKDKEKNGNRKTCYRLLENAKHQWEKLVYEAAEKAKPLGAQYVACDSWFGNPKTIRQIKSLGFDIVSHIKSGYLYCFTNGFYKAEYIQKHLDRSKDWCDLIRFGIFSYILGNLG